MTLFELMEVVKAHPESRDELLDRYYHKERKIVQAMLDNKYESHEGRRIYDIDR